MSNLEEVRLSRKAVYEGIVVDLEHWKVQLPDGHEATREVLLHPGAAAIVAVDDQGQIVLVRQYRTPLERLTIELPAGKLDSPDEDMMVCAQRELEEETGLRASSWRPLTVLATTPGFCNERIGIYLATGLEDGAVHLDDDEFVDVIRMPLEAAVERVMTGGICDSKTMVGILMAWQLIGQKNTFS